jgi:hypothetical protein
MRTTTTLTKKTGMKRTTTAENKNYVTAGYSCANTEIQMNQEANQ